MPRPSAAVRSRSAVSNSGSPKKTSAPWSESVIRLRRMTPAVAADRPPSSLRSALPSSDGEVADHRAQVLEVEQRQAARVGVVEDQPEARLLGVVQPEHLGQQDRARSDVTWRGPARRARGRPARGTRWGRPCRPRSARPRAARAVIRSPASPGAAMPDRSPLMSARKTGTPWADSCSAISCRVLVLPVPVAPATRPCRFSTRSGMRTGASGWAVPSRPRPRGRGRRR